VVCISKATHSAPHRLGSSWLSVSILLGYLSERPTGCGGIILIIIIIIINYLTQVNAAQKAYEGASEVAQEALERARLEVKMAEAAVTLSADVRTVAKATGAKARAAMESIAATAAAAATQDAANIHRCQE
jgi:hypothetical protein